MGKENLWKFELMSPEFLITKGWITTIITLTANTPQLLFRANEEKIIVVANINNPNNTPLFIGPTSSVSQLNGFPIVSGERLKIGMLENTVVYGYSVAALNIYLLDVGV